jgi:AcrR family transcriptional regulator
MARTVNAEQHAAKRQGILHAAAQLFAQRGYHGTSIALICQAAGISSGNLFHYFPSKRVLFAALISGDGVDNGESHTAVADAYKANDPVQGLLGYVGHLAAGAAGPVTPGLVVEAMVQAGRDSELAALMEDGSDSEQRHVAALLRRAQQTGAVDTSLDVEACAAWIMTLVSALYLHAATNPDLDHTAQHRMLRRTVQRFIQP